MKSIPRYLHNPQALLGQLQQHVAELNRLTATARRCLPDDIAPLCQVVRHQRSDDSLILSVSEQLYLTQLHFLRPTFLLQLRQHAPFKQLVRIEWIFTPVIPGPNQQHLPPLQLSPEAKSACRNAADLCQHEPLKKALEELAKG